MNKRLNPVQNILSFVVIVQLALISMLVVHYNVQAQATPLYDFGGRITAIAPCPLAGGLIMAVVGPRPGIFTYTFGGSFSFAYGPPRNPGQSLLGKSIPTPVPCTPLGPVGIPIFYHGSSALI